MTIWSQMLVAFQALRLNALRSLLAMLGVIIGVASVIVMVSISSGARQVVESQIQSLGSNQLMAFPGSSNMGGRRGGSGSATPFSDGDVEAIANRVPGVVTAVGVVQGSAPLVAGNVNWTTSVLGVGPDYPQVRDWSIGEGRFFGAGEVRSSGKVAVLGRTVAEKMFEGADPVGATIRIRNIPFKIIGVLAEKGANMMGSDQDDLVLVPVSTARTRLFGRDDTVPDRVQQMLIQIEPGEDMAMVQGDIETLLRERRRIRPGGQDDFSVRNLAEFIRARTATQATLGLLLGATAAISLLVGGIGIMNIMLVSVTERTREIGLRLAVGARPRDVLGQFLVEAVTLCLVGGAIGGLIGMAGSFAMAQFGDWPVAVDPSMVGLALGSSLLVGVFFGFYPARRAARLNPIEALRFE
ncbi:ABC transporter permease [Indioceanicola profundi]|uniref:ABC transporter permease n=1 Tax=Indioceanicola profundi TaxID=2220096 RepID=UPI000E6AC095|nr:ABC transporter permease [Indioceanicola profundi]